tara:strand:+ start:159 stop:374 length:216 start_codon:yes stop_codon:yes gene_type:complete
VTLGDSRNEHYWFSGAFCLSQPAFPSAMPSDLTGIIRTIKLGPQQAGKTKTKKNTNNFHSNKSIVPDELTE